MLEVLMAFRMYVELNNHISYIEKKRKNSVSRRLRPTALVVQNVVRQR